MAISVLFLLSPPFLDGLLCFHPALLDVPSPLIHITRPAGSHSGTQTCLGPKGPLSQEKPRSQPLFLGSAQGSPPQKDGEGVA